MSMEFGTFGSHRLVPRVGQLGTNVPGCGHVTDPSSVLAMVGTKDWVALGAADEQKPAGDGTLEAWARSESNPLGGWYGRARPGVAP